VDKEINKMKLKEILEDYENKADKTLWKNEWISVKEKDGWYTYTHQEKSGGKAVAVLAYSIDPLMILGRYEKTPCHNDGVSLTALTGMVEKGNSPLETAIRELEEESGIKMDAEDFQSLGFTRPGKSSDTIMYLFAVKIPFEEGEYIGKGDGTKGEEGSYCKFVSIDEAINSKSETISAMILRALRSEL